VPFWLPADLVPVNSSAEVPAKLDTERAEGSASQSVPGDSQSAAGANQGEGSSQAAAGVSAGIVATQGLFSFLRPAAGGRVVLGARRPLSPAHAPAAGGAKAPASNHAERRIATGEPETADSAHGRTWLFASLLVALSGLVMYVFLGEVSTIIKEASNQQNKSTRYIPTWLEIWSVYLKYLLLQGNYTWLAVHILTPIALICCLIYISRGLPGVTARSVFNITWFSVLGGFYVGYAKHKDFNEVRWVLNR
jgi:hypothetical protein